MCTTKKQSVVLTNNNVSYKSGNTKAIWSPASSCEEENRHQLSCHACQRSFASPTKLELHLKKVHPQPNSAKPSATRKERLFKVLPPFPPFRVRARVTFFYHYDYLAVARDRFLSRAYLAVLKSPFFYFFPCVRKIEEIIFKLFSHIIFTCNGCQNVSTKKSCVDME